MDYNNSFENRVKYFLKAVDTYPHSMEFEFKTALEELDLKDDEILLNLGGGGLNLNNYITNKITYIPVEFNLEFSNYCNIPLVSHKHLPFENNSIDKIIILALLHHFSNKEREELYKECFRVLKPSGKFIVADVLKDSDQDTWLNTIVDKYNPVGHRGVFFTIHDKKLLNECKFNVEIKIKNYSWWYNNREEMFDYLKNLFYLNISNDDIDKVVNNTLHPKVIKDKIYTDWKLIYFICSK